MASDTGTTRAEAASSQRGGAQAGPEPPQRTLFSSRITRLIFYWNLVGFAILAAGALLLSEMRAQLVRAKAESLLTQAELIANAISDVATIGEPAPALQERNAREVLRRLMVPADTRVRLFAPDGVTVADTDLLSDRVQEALLPPIFGVAAPKPAAAASFFGRALRKMESWTVLPWRPDYSLEKEIARAALGQRLSGRRFGADGERVVSVAIPIQHVQAVVGVLVAESGGVDEIVAAERRAMTPFIVSAAAVSLLSSALLALFLANPLRNLARAADRLRLGVAPRWEGEPEAMARKDEIGDLARALSQMTDALLERSEANERFAADVSHEIKNPLTSIRSAVETAQNVKDADARARLLGIIAADVGRLDRLITDISRASRIEAETVRGETGRINLGRMLSDIVGTYEQTRREGEAAVVYDGPVTSEWALIGQDGPIGQVFRNLIDNAKSFSPGDRDVTVSLRVENGRDGRFFLAQVEDRGPGIPPENLETIFRRFYTDRPKGSTFGANSGLGLSIARQIVEAHKGSIWAENIQQSDGQVRGARFVVRLPAVSAAPQ